MTLVRLSLPLQRPSNRLSAAVTSPTRCDRLGVAATFRVLFGTRGIEAIGFLDPGSTLALAGALFFRSSLCAPRLRTRLLERSSLGVQLSFTVLPNQPARRPSTTSTSLGVSRPDSALGEGSPRPHKVSLVLAPWVLPRRLQAVPSYPVRCRSQAFPASQRLLPPPTVLPYFRQVTLVGLTLQGFAPP